ncbi:MAG: lysoplasmalogenase [Desulfobacterales bacterium]|nr:lysoplasmalogenase [Desulfobacterales bacterium]
MTSCWIIFLAAILLPGLLYFEYRKNTRGVLLTKTPLSALFILAALVQPHPAPGYFSFLLAGLAFCMGGDVLLALPGKKTFLFGLVSFLTGHALYVAGFFHLAGPNTWTWLGTGVVAPVSAGVYFLLKERLGAMKIPVLFYIVVISLMIGGAWTVFGDPALHRTGRLVVLAGAWSFYVSDLFVARNRFVKEEIINRLFGLPLYYLGQFLLAFSAGLVN